jgi:starch-binding outer membrane protein, SusD/RagB family
MTINKMMLLAAILIAGTTQQGCKKYLEAKPDKALAVPKSLQDLQALLDYYTRVNNADPTAPVQSVDDFYLSETDYNTLTNDSYKQLYTWGSKYLFTDWPNDWSYQYDKVNIANIVLDNIGQIARTDNNSQQWNDIKGQALLLRARSLQWVAWEWAKAYHKTSAMSDMGIPLRLQSNFNVPSVRAGLQETYDRIIADYKASVHLLPVVPVHVMRPSQPAAYGLLARTYLSMGDYVNAGQYSDSCLRLFSTLIDFNTLNSAASYPVPRFNNEVIMDNRMWAVPSMFVGAKAKIDTTLFQSYADDDLRKTVFFKKGNGYYNFKGSYEGGSAMFSGIAADEVMLMKAECLARSGNTSAAMDELNSLLVKRWESGTFSPFTATDENEALDKILTERRKELLMRGLRWMDIKRLNKEGGPVVMKRIINGQIYSLPPNDLRYAFPIPDDIISLTGMPQNPE